jgi:hypothetical protein
MTKPLFAENDDELTPDEVRAIQALERLSKRWPRSLTLMSMGGGLCVKHTGDPRFDEAFSVDRAGCVLYSFVGIPNDGGDW